MLASAVSLAAADDGGIMRELIMIQEPFHRRLLTALRLALYPAFEPAAARRLEALTREAENARGSGDLARARELYLTAMAEARGASDPLHLNHARFGLARVYQEQHRYREAERIFRDQLEEAVNSPQPNTQVHAGHMCLARLYHDEGKFAEAEKHYKAAVLEAENPEFGPGLGMFCSTSMWLAKFYVEQHRYSEAEPLFQRALEIYEEDRRPNSYLPHHLEEFAKLYEAQEKYAAAEELYRRALRICEEQGEGGHSAIWLLARALDNLAAFYKARGRFLEAEDLCRRSLGIVEESVRSEAAKSTKSWLRWRKSKELEARISRSQLPISTALDRLAELYERQEKYADAEPLWRRSFEIKERVWGETHSWIWVDSLAAYANALHKIGREHEATKINERVKAIRTKYPPGSVHSSVSLTSMPINRNLRWRFATFVNTVLRPTHH
jgi:tetratricopeptide (TPR) repeat protein